MTAMKMIVHRYRMLLTLVLGALAGWAVAALEPDGVEDPQALIRGMTDSLIRELREHTEAIKADEQLAYRISDRLVEPNLDFERITRLVVGKHWRRASDEQKKKLVAEMRKLIVRSYVTAMRAYADQIVAHGDRIDYLPSRYRPGDRKAMVSASLNLEGNKPVQVQYLLLRVGERWKIYDIRIEGISLAITYRTSFNAEIQRNGIDGLIARLEERNKNGAVSLPPGVKVPIKAAPLPR